MSQDAQQLGGWVRDVGDGGGGAIGEQRDVR